MPTYETPSLSAIHVPIILRRLDLFNDFAKVIGAETLVQAYGVWPPVHLMSAGSQMWTFEEGGALVAWGALTPEPSERAVWLSVGVWPDYAGRGVRHVVREHLWAVAQASGVRHGRIGVLMTNTRHLWRCYAEAGADGPWRHAGMVWYPAPGYAIFARQAQP